MALNGSIFALLAHKWHTNSVVAHASFLFVWDCFLVRIGIFNLITLWFLTIFFWYYKNQNISSAQNYLTYTILYGIIIMEGVIMAVYYYKLWALMSEKQINQKKLSEVQVYQRQLFFKWNEMNMYRYLYWIELQCFYIAIIKIW